MEGEFQEQRSNLLDLSAAGDLSGFVRAVEEKGLDVDEASLWYGRRLGSKKMGFEERTPLMIASMYGSTEVLKYIIGTGKVDVNRAGDSDGATALHCAAAGGSDSSVETVKLLLDASADVNSLDANGNKPGDLIAPYLKPSSNYKRKTLEVYLRLVNSSTFADQEMESQLNVVPQLSEKKEYPLDIPLPDINNGIYGSDEFRMYSFKVKPCSRAYSHDWTECPFVHPGENARRRDPKKYHYSCVPCPEFRKASCVKGDACEYAHGVFESWLHPAQYRTRLCKDETGCSRKVCFFAHKPEELRPLYASTGSAMPSPTNSISVSSMDMATLNSTPPMSPSAACSSPMWQNKVNLTPPALQLPGSRLKAAMSAREFEMEMELLGLDNIRTQQQQQQQQQQQRQQLVDELSSLSSPSMWNNEYNRFGKLTPTNLDNVFGSLDSSSMLSQLQSLSPKLSTTTTTTNTQLQSPTGLQMRQNMNQLRGSYPSNISSSPVRKPTTFGFDSSAAVAQAVMNSRSASFAKRSQSFVDRGAPANHRPGPTLLSSNLSGWSSPDGKLDWGYNGEDLNKLKKSASFGFRSANAGTTKMGMMTTSNADEPDVSWVNSLVKDVPSVGAGLYRSEQKYGSMNEMLPPWVEQMYIEQEQMVA